MIEFFGVSVLCAECLVKPYFHRRSKNSRGLGHPVPGLIRKIGLAFSGYLSMGVSQNKGPQYRPPKYYDPYDRNPSNRYP